MAKVSVLTKYGVNMLEFNFSALLDGMVLKSTATVFSIFHGGYTYEFKGKGFRYNASDLPIDGVVKSYAAKANLSPIFAIEGISVPFKTIMKAARTYDLLDDANVLLKVLSGKDIVNGHDGPDFLVSGAKADTVHGWGGDDIIIGGAGVDRIYGDNGNDLLAGGGGKDHLFGGLGSDGFGFAFLTDSTVKPKGRDVIHDFSKSEGDYIDFSALDAKSGTKRIDAFTFIGKDAFSGRKGELRYTNVKKDTFVYGDVNGDAKADFAVQIKGKFALTADDFLL